MVEQLYQNGFTLYKYIHNDNKFFFAYLMGYIVYTYISGLK